MGSPASRVLGTEVFGMTGEAPRALLISDLHVPADGGPVLTQLQAVLTAARRLDASVFVLGDLFDSYVSRGQVRVGVWAEVAAIFAGAVAAGTPIEMLVGNRDFLLGDEFARASGVRIANGGLRGRIGGVDTLLLHGDELCVADLPYQRAKRWLRHPVTRWCLHRLPVGLALKAAERARKKSRRVTASGDPTRFLPTREALATAMACGAVRLVFGHIHRHAHDGGAAGYWVLPAFDATTVGLCIEPGAIRPVRFVGTEGELEAVPEPGPLPLLAWAGESAPPQPC